VGDLLARDRGGAGQVLLDERDLAVLVVDLADRPRQPRREPGERPDEAGGAGVVFRLEGGEVAPDELLEHAAVPVLQEQLRPNVRFHDTSSSPS
jgi:hypothetical protein